MFYGQPVDTFDADGNFVAIATMAMQLSKERPIVRDGDDVMAMPVGAH